jgi:hypothetical protein
MDENHTDKNRTDENHETHTDKIVELNAEETEQVVGGKHVNVSPGRRTDPFPEKM